MAAQEMMPLTVGFKLLPYWCLCSPRVVPFCCAISALNAGVLNEEAVLLTVNPSVTLGRQRQSLEKLATSRLKTLHGHILIFNRQTLPGCVARSGPLCLASSLLA